MSTVCLIFFWQRQCYYKKILQYDRFYNKQRYKVAADKNFYQRHLKKSNDQHKVNKNRSSSLQYRRKTIRASNGHASQQRCRAAPISSRRAAGLCVRWGGSIAGKRYRRLTSRTWQPAEPCVLPEDSSLRQVPFLHKKACKPPYGSSCCAFHRVDPGCCRSGKKKSPDH